MKTQHRLPILVILILMSLSPLFAEDTFIDHYKKGREAMDKKEYKAAIHRLELAIAEHPESSENIRTYGVQFISYHPYTYLAEAYLWLGEPGSNEKAKQYIEKAFANQEHDTKKFPELKNKANRLNQILDALLEPKTEAGKPEIPLDTVNDLITEGRFNEALDQVNLLIHSFPDEVILKSTKLLLQEFNQKNTTAEESELAYRENLQEYLQKARAYAESGETEVAFQYYLFVDELDTGNIESAEFIEQFKINLASQGETQEEIELKLASYKAEKQDLLNKLSEQTRRNRRIQAELEKLKRGIASAKPIKPELKIEWDPKPVVDKELVYHLSATIRSNIPIQTVKLFINGSLVKTSKNLNKKTIRLPTISNYRFIDYQNKLRLEIIDINGNTLTDEYPLNIPKTTNRFYDFLPKLFLFFALFTASYFYTTRQRKRRMAFRERFNPYIAGAPVFSNSMFYGRHDLVKQILNTLHNNSMMICGERRIGKTTFLHRLLSVLPQIDDPDYQFYPIMIDLQGMVEDDFFSSMDHEIMESLRETGLDLPEEWEGNMDVRTFTKRLRHVIGELKTHSNRTPKLVLLLDEVDVMNSFSEKTNQQLRSVFMKGFAKYLVAVMAGINLKKRWESEGSPWYNFFEQIELEPFTERHARALIELPVKGIYSYTEEAELRILELSELKPYIIQRLCVNLVASILSENRKKITKRDVDEVFSAFQKEKGL